MTRLRTQDLEYGESYWETLDDGAGYSDGVVWENLACAVQEVFAYSEDKTSDIIHLRNPVLDVGCAHGFLVRHLRRRGFDAWGCDVSNYALNRAPDDVSHLLKYADVTVSSLECGVLTQYQEYKDLDWGLIISLETLEHIPEEHVRTVLRAMRDALADDGVLLLSICTEEVPDYDTDPTHITIKPADWWDAELELAGLKRNRAHEHALRSWRFFANHPGLFVLEKDRT